MIALNLHTKRVYIRGDIQKAYRWLSNLFDRPDMLAFSVPFLLKENLDSDEAERKFEILKHSDWTVEHNPEPANGWVKDV